MAIYRTSPLRQFITRNKNHIATLTGVLLALALLCALAAM